MSEFYREGSVNAIRKAHRCHGCCRLMEVGSPAYTFAMQQDGEFYAGHYHQDCRKAEVALNDLLQSSYGEWALLQEIDDEDRAWLREEYPDVAARMFRDMSA